MFSEAAAYKAVIVTIVLIFIFVACYVWEQYRNYRIDRVEVTYLGLLVTGLCVLCALLYMTHFANARDDGRYADSPLRSWFNHLASKKGNCCSFADGATVEDPDWKTAGDHYSVRLDGRWIEVPDEAVITEPNQFGKTMVWPVGSGDNVAIRCFMPGSMT